MRGRRIQSSGVEADEGVLLCSISPFRPRQCLFIFKVRSVARPSSLLAEQLFFNLPIHSMMPNLQASLMNPSIFLDDYGSLFLLAASFLLDLFLASRTHRYRYIPFKRHYCRSCPSRSTRFIQVGCEYWGNKLLYGINIFISNVVILSAGHVEVFN